MTAAARDGCASCRYPGATETAQSVPADTPARSRALPYAERCATPSTADPDGCRGHRRPGLHPADHGAAAGFGPAGLFPTVRVLPERPETCASSAGLPLHRTCAAAWT